MAVEPADTRAGATEWIVEVDGARARAVAYDGLVAPIKTGDVLILNTSAVAAGLGTGGMHFVIAVEGREHDAPARAAMKLRYTPVQAPVDVVEETHAAALDGVRSLDGMPVVVAGLHSALAPAAIAARVVSPAARIAYVMTDAAALHIGFSRSVPALRHAGLLAETYTAGQAVGGDHEAVTVHGALVAARAVTGAALAIVTMGPGNLGSGSRFGFASLEVAAIVDAVDALGGRAVVAPRLSFADPRARHHGISHHTSTALAVARSRALVAMPSLTPEQAASVRPQLDAIAERHDVVEVDLGAADDALRSSPVALRSMGRTFEEDPDYFRAAAAAGVVAAALLTSTR